MKTSQARQKKKKTFRIYQQGLWDGTRHPCEHFSNYDDSNVDGGHHHHHLLRPSIASVPYTRKIRPLSMTSLVPLISCRMVSIRVSSKFILADMVTAGLTMEVPTNKQGRQRGELQVLVNNAAILLSLGVVHMCACVLVPCYCCP